MQVKAFAKVGQESEALAQAFVHLLISYLIHAYLYVCKYRIWGQVLSGASLSPYSSCGWRASVSFVQMKTAESQGGSFEAVQGSFTVVVVLHRVIPEGQLRGITGN